MDGRPTLRLQASGSAVSLESCRVSCSVLPHDVPVTANHVVGDGPTKMIGAKHGLGSPTVASISESPVAVAGNGPVATFVVPGPPPPAFHRLRARPYPLRSARVGHPR